MHMYKRGEAREKL